MCGDRQLTVIRVTSDDAGRRTVAVSGLLDASAVASVCAAGVRARAEHALLVLDLRAVTSVDGDCLAQLARALRESGVNLDTRTSAPRRD